MLIGEGDARELAGLSGGWEINETNDSICQSHRRQHRCWLIAFIQPGEKKQIKCLGKVTAVVGDTISGSRKTVKLIVCT